MIRVFIEKCGNTHSEQHDTAYRLLFDKTEELFGYSADFDDISVMDKGKPYFSDIPVEFSISHCKGYAVCAFCGRDEGSVGVDCEIIRPFREASMGRIFSAYEMEMIKNSDSPDLLCTRLWTLKECYVKYTGTGLAGHMRERSFSFDGDRVLSDGDSVFISKLIGDSAVVSLCCVKGSSAEFILYP
ncbi:MAG: 4'-phosphopantetheinyl transferase family protein [Oscillospiraceae bacterium]